MARSRKRRLEASLAGREIPLAKNREAIQSQPPHPRPARPTASSPTPSLPPSVHRRTNNPDRPYQICAQTIAPIINLNFKLPSPSLSFPLFNSAVERREPVAASILLARLPYCTSYFVRPGTNLRRKGEARTASHKTRVFSVRGYRDSPECGLF